MAGFTSQISGIKAEQMHRCRETLFDRHIKQNRRIGFHRQPAIAQNFFLELTRAPACATECDDQTLRTIARRHLLQDIA